MDFFTFINQQFVDNSTRWGVAGIFDKIGCEQKKSEPLYPVSGGGLYLCIPNCQ